MNVQTLLSIMTLILGSSLLVALFNNQQKTRLKKKELVAAATRSALKRVEMFYRVYRRLDNKEDAAKIRDEFHIIQEENAYYQSLLSVESRWLGYCYDLFIEALQRETKQKLQDAWDGPPHGPGARIEGISVPNVTKYVDQFTRDCRRQFNYFMRPLMWVRHVALYKLITYKGYV